MPLHLHAHADGALRGQGENDVTSAGHRDVVAGVAMLLLLLLSAQSVGDQVGQVTVLFNVGGLIVI